LSQSLGRIEAIQGEKEGRAVLGVVSRAKHFAPRLIRTLRQLHPEFETAPQVGNRKEILRDLALIGWTPTGTLGPRQSGQTGRWPPIANRRGLWVGRL
jgi:hypothetical protein